MSNKTDGKRQRNYGRRMLSFARQGARPLTRELASTAVLAGVGSAMLYWENDIVKAMQEGARHGHHAYRTGREILTGAEGMKASMQYGEALDVLVEEARYDPVLNRELIENIDSRIELVGKLKNTYEVNETLGRESGRLFAQIKGMATELTAAGDEAAGKVSFGLTKKVDDFFMNLVGDAKDARENLPELQTLYREVRKFYDGRAKLEDTISKACDYLAENESRITLENKEIDREFDRMAVSLDETYSTENEVFALDDKVSFMRTILGKHKENLTRRDVNELREKVEGYNYGVNELRATTEDALPIGMYKDPMAWVDVGVNPVTLGIMGAVVLKGLSKFSKVTDKGLTYATLAPIYLGKKISKMGKKAHANWKKESEKLKSDGGVE